MGYKIVELLDDDANQLYPQTSGNAITVDWNSTSVSLQSIIDDIAAAQGGSSSGGSTTLAGLTDVTLGSSLNGKYLKHNGTNWVDATLPSASLSAQGVVMLSSSTSSDSTTIAANSLAVKTAYDLAGNAIPKSTGTTAGDILYFTGDSAPTRLGIGSSGQVLTVSSGVPAWATPSSGGTTVTLPSGYSDSTGITLSSSTLTTIATIGGTELKLKAPASSGGGGDNPYPTAMSWNNGTSAGPTAKITMSDATYITSSAIPTASASISGIITTGAQTLAGVKTFSSSPKLSTNTITTSGSGTQTFPNTTGTIVNGTGTSGYLAKWNGTNSITNGPAFGSSTTTFLRNDGTWATPSGGGGGTTYYDGNGIIFSGSTDINTMTVDAAQFGDSVVLSPDAGYIMPVYHIETNGGQRMHLSPGDKYNVAAYNALGPIEELTYSDGNTYNFNFNSEQGDYLPEKALFVPVPSPLVTFLQGVYTLMDSVGTPEEIFGNLFVAAGYDNPYE